MKKTHYLKTWPEFFAPLLSGEKTFELRKGDRLFEVGDTIILQEYDPWKGYTGNGISKEITYILTGLPWLAPGYVAIGFK